MWIIVLLILLVAIYGLTQTGLVPPPNAVVVMQIRSGKVRITRGRLNPQAKEHVTDILAEAGVKKGFVALTRKRVIFSRHIPPNIHQQLRNVLLNQWA